MSYFYSLEVVDRGSETQLQVGENKTLSSFVQMFCVCWDHVINTIIGGNNVCGR